MNIRRKGPPGIIRRKCNAFSILEIPIAMTVLTIGLLFLFGVFPTSFQGVSKGKNILSGAQIAEQLLQKAQNASFDTMQTTYDPISNTPTSVQFSFASTLNGVTSTTEYVYEVNETAYHVDSCTNPTTSGSTTCYKSDIVAHPQILQYALTKDVEVFVYINGTWDLYRYVTRIAR